MIVIYTFDFRKDDSTSQRNDEYVMLVSSIQSVLDNHFDPLRILVYTGDNSLKEKILREFPMVEIMVTQKYDYCDASNFTCAGHERMNALKSHVNTDDLLYLDNDTMVDPSGLSALVHTHRPMGYMKEDWQTIDQWIKICVKKPEDQESASALASDLVGHWCLDQHICNNGAQFYPKNSYLSREIIDLTNIFYDRFCDTVGYSYGFDQLAFTLALYRLDHGVPCMMMTDGYTSTVWHAYRFKNLYKKNLKKIGIIVGVNGIVGEDRSSNVFMKLQRLYLEEVT
jgi:hypothetical protein